MNISRLCKRRAGKKQSGFTMIELLVVLALVSILMLIVARSFFGGTDKSLATLLGSNSEELARGMSFIHINMGNGYNPTSANPIAGGSGGMLAVLVEGEDAVKPAMKNAYQRIGMRPLSNAIKKEGTDYYLNSYKVTMPVCTGSAANRKICVRYENVPTSVAEALAERAKLTLEQAASKTPLQDDLHISGANSSGHHTVTFAIVP